MAATRLRLLLIQPLLLFLCSTLALALYVPHEARRAHPLASRQEQNSTATLLQALREAKLTKLASLLDKNPVVLQQVNQSPGLKTLLAPTDDALPLPSWADVPNVLLYHFLNGTVPPDAYERLPVHTVVHSMLTTASAAHLPGGNGQAVAMSTGRTYGSYRQDTRQVNEALNVNRFTRQSAITVGKISVQPISRALTIPGNATYTISAVGRSGAFARLVNMLPFILDEMRGVTLFVPSDEAVSTFRLRHPNLSKADVTAVLKNHIISNRVVYSPLLIQQASLISMAGQDMVVTDDSNSSTGGMSKLRISVGNTSATITQTDLMHSGGVVHLIDAVLFNVQNDASRAEQAIVSAHDSANSYVAGVISASNAASSQGQSVPPSPSDSAKPLAQNSTVSAMDATQGGKFPAVIAGATGPGSEAMEAKSPSIRHVYRNGSRLSSTLPGLFLITFPLLLSAVLLCA